MGLLRKAPSAGALVVLLALAAAAPASAAPSPFGHACVPQDGVRFCPTGDLASRVASWDGTPLDVDVTLPAEGEGPFPTVVLHHGLGQTKTAFQPSSGGDPLYTNVELARRGFAVMQPTARGFGGSCGTPESRTAGCEGGFTRLMDVRYEVRDVQHLLGLLVDQGVTRPDAIGSTGVSYGGGMTTMLAYLRDRVRLPDGGFAPWTSPNGTPLSLAAAWPRWGWTNGAAIFTRNGRDPWSQRPVGAATKAYGDAIFGVTGIAFTAPTGGELSSDVTLWKRVLDTGRDTAQARAILDNAYRFHGVTTIPGKPSPLLIQQGWTDALFPVPQALGAYDRLLGADRDAPVALQLGDLGHSPGANHPRDVAEQGRQGLAFLESWLLGRGVKLRPGQVTAYTTRCPKTAPSGGGPFTASTYNRLAGRRVKVIARGTLRITSRGASRQLAADLAPVAGKGSDLCTRHREDRTSRARISVAFGGRTLIGRPVLAGRATARGAYAAVFARVWDLDPKTGTQRLVTRGAYRLDAGDRPFRFALDGNGWTFPKGHRLVLELLGRDAPTYLPAPSAFSATFSQLRLTVPVRR